MRMFLPDLLKSLPDQVDFTFAAGAGWGEQGERIHGHLRQLLGPGPQVVARTLVPRSPNPSSQWHRIQGDEERLSVGLMQVAPGNNTSDRFKKKKKRHDQGRRQKDRNQSLQNQPENWQQVEGNCQTWESDLKNSEHFKWERRCCECQLINIRLG